MERIKKCLFTFCTIICIVMITAMSANAAPSITYKAHVSDKGWMSQVSNGSTAGTTGQAKALEALSINFSGIQYRAHVSDIGWQSWVTSGKTAGTTGKAKAMEAIQIKLTGTNASKYNVYYRVHVRDYGWLGWARNGATAGSTGLNLRIEAIQIKVVSKTSSFSTGGKATLSKPTLNYKSHVSDMGWLAQTKEGNIAGTTGKGKQMEAVIINLKDFKGNNGIQYRAHVSDIGWQSWVTSGKTAGTTGKVKAIEAVQIKLSNSLANFFDLYYRVHVKNLGWLGWTANGASAGTAGGALSVEAIQIKLVNKGGAAPGGGTAYYDLTKKNDSVSWQYPVKGYTVTQKFGNYSSTMAKKSRPYHSGIDIVYKSNKTIYAAATGIVEYVGYSSGNGNHVILSHQMGGKTVKSLYSHLSSYSVRKGQKVQGGIAIGIMGNTGNSTGTHLHFAIFEGSGTDPLGYVGSYNSANKLMQGGVIFYNPVYVVNNNKLP